VAVGACELVSECKECVRAVGSAAALELRDCGVKCDSEYSAVAARSPPLLPARLSPCMLGEEELACELVRRMGEDAAYPAPQLKGISNGEDLVHPAR
jgi:hypothetical protein